ncbi:hypothetical protein A3I58_03760 [Candidatus Peregrinibacteria bacterium RIFCSPLOWO2_02_FULL_39_10]|nr:MAG: hypothetical protein A3I58_03760 [Candidatus Peregrinibacteria bacterium RIFCSPLOWO2_02_FULL_39_10]
MNITDEKLYELCKKFGASALLWRQKFIGLLPEVNRRRLYEKKGFSSIFEFAFKLCGLSAEQVRLTLNLEKRFEDKPVLKKMLEDGEASINKLARVVSIATPENEEELAEKIKVLPTRALETFVRDEKYLQNPNGSQKPLFGNKSLHVQTLNFEISDDVKEELNKLSSKGIDVNKLLRNMLKRRKEKIAETKEKISENIKPTSSYYISVKIRKILKEEHGKKCSIATCSKPATTIHHTQRFRLSQTHDPRFLAPLCAEHHAIAHSIDLKYHRARDKARV